jgi:CotH kinase protein/Lamin Tail Domain/Secretion system C-terminal sorting domain
MLKSAFLSLIGLVLFCQVQAQVFTNSNLPIVLITTDNDPSTGQPKPIVDDPRVLGTMKIIYHTDGTRNYVNNINTPEFINYDGRIDIEIRGSSSQDIPKKSYGFSTLLPDNITDNNVSLLNMPQEHDWVLSGIAFDTSMVRDYVSYHIAREMGNYASRTAYCEVMLNGQYIGLYMLLEKLKRDENRVDILPMTATDNTEPNISGGYITKCDKMTGGDFAAWEMSSYVWGNPAQFIHHYPDPEDITSAQDDYIHDEFLSLASKAGLHNSNIATGYPTDIDVPSFIDFMLLSELASNPDVYQMSTFFHKDRNGKLRAGPIWDFNLTYGNDLLLYGFDRSQPDVWQFADNGNDGAKFWKDLYDSPTYKCYLAKRWFNLIQPGQPFNYDVISDFIDVTVDSISEALVRENQKWDNVPDHALEIEKLKNFLVARIPWISSHIGSYTGCANVSLPPLVISKINYHPAATVNFPVSEDLEFVEITNNGSQVIDLTGIYFRELGFTYGFAAGATVGPNQSIYLASNIEAFENYYYQTAFGQFSRDLSNKSQKLMLVDAFGNVIDLVEYQDEAPWPVEPDGSGSFLTLIDNDLDNALASSWQSGSISLINALDKEFETTTTVYPNPTESKLFVNNSSFEILGCEVYDFQGRLLKIETKSQPEAMSVNTESLSENNYMLKINFAGGISIYRTFTKL